MTLEQALMMEAYYRVRNLDHFLTESELAFWRLANETIKKHAENSVFVPVEVSGNFLLGNMPQPE